MPEDSLLWWVHAAVRNRARRKLDLYNATNVVNMKERAREAFVKQLERDLKSGLEDDADRPETKEDFEARLKRIDAAFAMMGGGRRRKG